MRNARATALAFTLVELLVTLSIIAVLAGLLLPALSRGKESGRVASCQGNLHQIGLALQLYTGDNNNIMPTMEDYTNGPASNQPTINLILAPQLGSTNVLCCPSDTQQIFQLTGSSYSWNYLVNGQNADQLHVLNLNLAMIRIPLVFDKQNFHAALGTNHAQNYLYADGHIKNLLIISGSQ
jgi:prepilin-type N-terminal cleavage/methylation domain-containing protein